MSSDRAFDHDAFDSGAFDAVVPVRLPVATASITARHMAAQLGQRRMTAAISGRGKSVEVRRA